MAAQQVDGFIEAQPTTVIDLTQNDVLMPDAPAPLPLPPKEVKEEPIFVSTVAHRLPSPTIPHKRKSVNSSEDPLPLASRRPTPSTTIPKPAQPSTPSPRASQQPNSNVEVVIPSPSAQQRKLLKESKPQKKITGLSKRYFPVNLEEKAAAIQCRYPEVRHVDRSIVPFGITPKPFKPSSVTPSQFMRHMQIQKLKRIDGVELSREIDDEKLAILFANFGFIKDYKLQDGVAPVSKLFLAGCDCAGQCDEGSCECLIQEETSNKKIVAYHLVGDRVVLRPDFLKRKSIISECSSRCSCKDKCWNHVVQRGRKVRLEIFDTGERGFGLRCLSSVITGQFIDLYLGEVITHKEADAREMADDKGQSYLFSLDWYVDDDEGIYVVDGQKFGSPTRFMNHSCNANCKIVPVTTTNSTDTRLYYLAFFAIKDIPAGTELTFDYNPHFKTSKAEDPDAVKCLCREPGCRKQLWPNARKKGQKM